MPSADLVIRKKVTTADGRVSIIEATITKNDSTPDGITWIKMYEEGDPNNFANFFVDTLNPELILTALENYLAKGKGPEIARFLHEEGKTVRNPVEFRLKLEATLGSMDMGGDAADIARGLF
jgi:hypothetical protein